MGANERKSILLFRLDRYACSLGDAEMDEPLVTLYVSADASAQNVSALKDLRRDLSRIVLQRDIM